MARRYARAEGMKVVIPDIDRRPVDQAVRLTSARAVPRRTEVVADVSQPPWSRRSARRDGWPSSSRSTWSATRRARPRHAGRGASRSTTWSEAHRCQPVGHPARDVACSLPLIRDQGEGHIVHIASLAAFRHQVARVQGRTRRQRSRSGGSPPPLPLPFSPLPHSSLSFLYLACSASAWAGWSCGHPRSGSRCRSWPGWVVAPNMCAAERNQPGERRPSDRLRPALRGTILRTPSA